MGNLTGHLKVSKNDIQLDYYISLSVSIFLPFDSICEEEMRHEC